MFERHEYINNACPSKKITHKEPKEMWAPETTNRALFSFMSLKANSNRGKRYLDSG